MEKTWILIANGERARCFERHAKDHSLTELADFVHTRATLSGTASGGDLTGAAGKGHGRTGHAGTQFEPHTQAQAKARGSFAHELADHLNDAVMAKRCSAWLLVAPSPMLGELKPCLNQAALQALKRSVANDLTQYSGPDLKKHLDHALALP
jgi:protein required for attachment to host cells